MPYLTYAEYEDLGFRIGEGEFDIVINKASDVLDYITNNFYQFNDLENDVKFRKIRFKKALAAQVNYFNDLGATTAHELKEYGNVTMGRTTLSKSSSRTGDKEEKSNKLISKDVYIYLSGTGLLYKGIGGI